MPIPRLHKGMEQNHRLTRPATASITEGTPVYLSPAPQVTRLDAGYTTTSPDSHASASF